MADTFEELLAEAKAEKATQDLNTPGISDSPFPELAPIPTAAEAARPVDLFPDLIDSAPAPIAPAQPVVQDLFADVQATPIEEPSLLSQAGNVVGSFFEGAGRKVASTLNIASATVPEPIEDVIDIADEQAGFGSQVASGLGGVAVQVGGTLAGAKAGGLAGAAIGSVVPGLGTAVGGVVGAGVGAAAAGGTFIVQAVRQGLFGVEEETKEAARAQGREATEGEIEEAKSLALPGLVTANTAEQLFVMATGGAGNIGVAVAKEGAKAVGKEGLRALGKEGLKKAAVAGAERLTAEQLAKEAAKQSLTRLGKISNVLKTGAIGFGVEGTSEAIEGVSTRAAAESVVSDTGFLEEAAEELTSEETLQEFLVGGTVGAIAGGGFKALEQRTQPGTDFEQGLEILSEESVIAQRARAIATNLAQLENPDSPVNEVTIPEVLATQKEVGEFMQNEQGFAVRANEDGSTTIQLTDPESVGLLAPDEDIRARIPLLSKNDNPLLQRQIVIDEEGNQIFEGSRIRPTLDEQGNIVVPTREDILAERLTLKLLDQNEIPIDFKRVTLEGQNLQQPENQELFSTNLESTDQNTSAENVTNLNPLNSIAAFLKKTVTPQGEKPVSAHIIENTSENLKQAIRTTAEFNMRTIDAGVNRAVKRMTSTGIQSKERLAEVRGEIDLAVNSYLTGESKLEDLPVEVRAGALNARGHIDKLSKQLIDEGIVEGDIAQIVDENVGTYLNRSYRIFNDPAWADQVKADQTTNSLYNQAKGYLRRRLPRLDNETRAQFDDRVNIIMHQLLERGNQSPLHFLSKDTVAARSLGPLLKRQDIPAEIRALWGERTSGVENYVNTILNMSNIISQHKFFTDLKDAGLQEGWLSNRPDPVRFPKQIVTETALEGISENPLKGMYATEPVAQMFEQLNRAEPGKLAKWYYTLNGAAKYSKTVLNPITHTRNFVSNIGFMIANGHFDLALYNAPRTTAIKTLFSDIAPESLIKHVEDNKGFETQEFRDAFARYVELGILNDSVTGSELHDTMRDGFVGDVSLQKWIDNTVAKKAARGAGFELAGRLYQAEDGFWKIMAFERERQRLQKDFGGELTSEELDRQAAAIVRATMPTYSQVPEYVKALRKLPIGPFISFPAEVLRTQVNVIKQARKEMADPRTRKTGIRRVSGLLTAHLGTLLGAALMNYATGVSEEEDEAIREMAAPWDRTGILVYWGDDKHGNPRYINQSFTDPFAIYKKPFIAAALANQDDDSLIAAGLSEFFSPFLSEDILAQRILDIRRNKKIDGRPIFNDTDEESTKMLKSFGHMWDGIKPGFIDTASKLFKGAAGEKRKGREVDFATELGAVTMGQRVTTLEPERNFPFIAFDFSRDLRDITSIFTKEARRADSSPERIERAFNRMMRQRERKYRQLTRKIKAGLALGMSEEDIRDDIKRARTIKKSDFNLVLEGGVPEFKPSDQFLNDLEQFEGRNDVVDNILERFRNEQR